MIQARIDNLVDKTLVPDGRPTPELLAPLAFFWALRVPFASIPAEVFVQAPRGSKAVLSQEVERDPAGVKGADSRALDGCIADRGRSFPVLGADFTPAGVVYQCLTP